MSKELIKRILSSIILIPLALYFILAGSFYFIFFTIICFLVASYEWHKMTKKMNYKLLGLIFLIFSFFTFYESLTDYYTGIFVLLICVATDVGGYIFGKIFKGPKLTKISPNKTYSGAIGSIFLSLIIFSSSIFYYTENFNIKILTVAVLTSISCQIGDLIFSFLKRKVKVKDTGNILPGHGGILDRLDGIFFGIPVGFILIILIF